MTIKIDAHRNTARFRTLPCIGTQCLSQSKLIDVTATTSYTGRYVFAYTREVIMNVQIALFFHICGVLALSVS
ncbi:MAG TPA: hypothetical protein VF221_00170, partial [Chloroflexota bacterium]